VKIDAETKEITVTSRVVTLVLTEDEYNAVKYALSKGADTYTSRRAIRNFAPPVTLMRRLLAEMQLVDEPSKVTDIDRELDEEEEVEEDEDD
jgi:hypothetical protein